MKKNRFYLDDVIHKTYKKNRLIVFGLFLLVIGFMSVGYASLNSILSLTGYANLNGEVGDLEIISVNEVGTSVNATSNGTSFYISDSSIDENVILAVELDMSFYRTMGNNNSLISYEVVIKNNSLTERKLSTVNSTPTFNSGNSSLNYTMDGITLLTTFISPGNSITVNLTFSLGEFERNTNYNVYEVFEFNFSRVTENDSQLNVNLNTSELNFSTFDDIKEVAFEVHNVSAQDITYNFKIDNNNFMVVDSNGGELSSFVVSAYTVDVSTFYLKVVDDHIFSDLSSIIDVTLVTTSPSILEYNLGSIDVSVPRDKVQDIIDDKTLYDDSTIDFTTTTLTSGLYKNSLNGDITYFYRGNVADNYVSFAGYIWRIIKIDRHGVRVILDSVIDTRSAWGTNPGTNADLSNAINVVNYANSPVKTVVDDWYNANLSDYSAVIKPSLFCLDTSYQTMVSSGNYGVTVYYFGSYIRNGKDSDGYTPEFICDSQYTKEYNIGLISGDEIAFAGGVFNTVNTNYYLYNSSINVNWWSLSPSYYDSSLGTVGMLLVNGNNGYFYDWPNGSTVENSYGIRPVITLDTDRISGGSGILGDEYIFSS